MKSTFQIAPLPRVFIGDEAIEALPDALRQFHARRPLVLTDPGLREVGIVPRVEAVLARSSDEIGVFDRLLPEPGFDLMEQAAEMLRSGGYDFLVGLGDGSTIDVAKWLSVLPPEPVPLTELLDDPDRLALRGIPVVAIPTTNGLGAEVSTTVSLKDPRARRMVRIQRPALVPRIAIIDPTLTHSLPRDLTAVSGVDALFHAIESYTSLSANHYTSLIAIQAIRLIAANIRQVVGNGDDRRSRYYVALGSFYAGLAQVNASPGPIHALAYPLTGRFDVSHGVAICLMALPVTEYIYPAVPDRFRAVAEALGENVRSLSDERSATLAFDRLRRLLREVQVPSKFTEYGIRGVEIDQLAEEAFSYGALLANSPREITLEQVRQFFRKAL